MYFAPAGKTNLTEDSLYLQLYRRGDDAVSEGGKREGWREGWRWMVYRREEGRKGGREGGREGWR